MSGLADRRRNLGPTDAVPFKSPFHNPDEIDVSTRVGAGPRPVFISQGVAAHASGSAYLETGSSKIQCSVHGPTQLRTGDRFYPQAEISVSVNVGSTTGVAADDAADLERTLGDFVRASITPAILRAQYPKSCITVALDVIGCGSPATAQASQLAAAVNVSMLALVNAGIALNDMITAASAAVIDRSSGRVVADADLSRDHEQVVATFANASGTSQAISVLVLAEGAVDRSTLENLLSCAETAAQDLRKVFNGYLIEDYATRYDNR